ncbi:MAG: FAD-dependent monooxygenase [Candidatus Rokuibacteriota bacterium]
MNRRTGGTWDVVIAGGGVAGVSVAAALGEFGYRVLLVEPGLNGAKRLAGELIHPPGVSDLADLGLLAPLERIGVAPVLGFAVSPHADAAPYLLPYGAIPGVRRRGFALDHAVLTVTLFAAAKQLPHVTTWQDARVCDLDLTPDGATVLIARPNGPTSVRARLVVAADGGASTVRRLASIAHTRVRLSHMLGVQLPGPLPEAGFGNVFLGGPAPVLAYAIDDVTARVMFDVPGNPDGIAAVRRDPAYLAALPREFRERVRAAVHAEPGLVCANYCVVPEAVATGCVVLVGDAAGSCHPLTATGLSACTRDAIRLRQALREADGDIPLAVRRYARARGGPQRTRVALAEALYRAFADPSDEMRLLRNGILKFWQRSRRGRAASMALLSTHEGRMSVMAVQYARVLGYALTGLVRLRGDGRARSPLARARAVMRLTRAALGLLAQAYRGRRLRHT